MIDNCANKIAQIAIELIQLPNSNVERAIELLKY